MIDAGTAFIDIVASDQKAAGAFSRTQLRLIALSQTMGLLGKTAIAAGAAAKVAEFMAVRTFAEMAEQIVRVSQESGIARQAVAEIAHVGAEAGLGVAEVGEALASITSKIRDAHAGRDAQTVGLLNAIGLEINNINRMNPEKQFDAIVDSLARIEDPARRARIAIRLFGASGGLIADFSREWAHMREEIQRAGLAMDENAIRRGMRLSGVITSLSMITRRFAAAVGDALSPRLVSMRDILIANSATILNFIASMDRTLAALSDGAKGAILIGAALMGLSVAVRVASVLFTPFLMGLFKTGIYLAIIGKSIGMTADMVRQYFPGIFSYLSGAFGGMVDRAFDAFSELAQITNQTMRGIRTALMNGDMEGALEIAKAGMLAAWETLSFLLQGTWIDFKQWLFDSWADMKFHWRSTLAEMGVWWERFKNKNSVAQFFEDSSTAMAMAVVDAMEGHASPSSWHNWIFGDLGGPAAPAARALTGRSGPGPMGQELRRQYAQRLRDRDPRATALGGLGAQVGPDGANVQRAQEIANGVAGEAARMNQAERNWNAEEREQALAELRRVQGGRIDLARNNLNQLVDVQVNRQNARANQRQFPAMPEIRPQQLNSPQSSFNAFAFGGTAWQSVTPIDRVARLQADANRLLDQIRQEIRNRQVALG